MPQTNEPTRYEIVLEINGSDSYFLGFSARLGRQPLFDAIAQHSQRLLEMIEDDDAPVRVTGGGRQCCIGFGGNLAVHYGRTERTVAHRDEDPLPALR